ncbi:hypothetical protein N431DRAFT_535758 [Stipitochalara longipes BDJ]|nr:hypothetical protein N431DRAFT_535758 [Stipitochalara longipes BDJ]
MSESDESQRELRRECQPARVANRPLLVVQQRSMPSQRPELKHQRPRGPIQPLPPPLTSPPPLPPSPPPAHGQHPAMDEHHHTSRLSRQAAITRNNGATLRLISAKRTGLSCLIMPTLGSTIDDRTVLGSKTPRQPERMVRRETLPLRA